jgi:hypothetical protein
MIAGLLITNHRSLKTFPRSLQGIATRLLALPPPLALSFTAYDA